MTELIHPPAWTAASACAQVGGDTWFPEQGQHDVVKAAKAICRDCPVRQACLAWALEHHEPYGIFGGLTARERARLRRAAA